MFQSAQTEQYKVGMDGNGFGVQYGARGDSLGGELFYNKVKSTGKIIHNSTDYDYNVDNSIYGASLQTYIQFFHIKIGYAFHSEKQYVTDSAGASVADSTIDTLYNVRGSQSGSGILIGAGLDMEWETFGVYLDGTRYAVNGSDDSFTVVQAGARWYPKFLDKIFGGKGGGSGPRK